MPRWKPVFAFALGIAATLPLQAEEVAWPPALKGAVQGTVTLKTDAFLAIPASVTTAREKPEAAPFTVAKSAPTVDLALHDQLGPNAATRRLWSSWGDIGLASDGRVYCAIGDHADDQNGDARCFLYSWDPKTKRLQQVVDMNKVVPPRPGHPAWSKVHAKIDEGPDHKIYFSCTLNDGNRASSPKYLFDEQLPGGQIYRYDPATGKTDVFANLPPRRCTATSLYDAERSIWWCNLEAGMGNALWGFNLKTRQEVYRGEEGSVGFNRAFTLMKDGSILFNAEQSLARLDPVSGKITPYKSTLGEKTGIRCATQESRDGHIYGVSYRTNLLYRFTPAKDELKILGPSWLTGEYTTICLLSPDEKYLYYFPGAHGGAFKTGTPIIQYDIARNSRKVIAFLAPAFEETHQYVPAGTYGAKISADGSTLYVNFNGHPGDSLRPAKMKPIGFGLTSFAAIHIPASER